MREARALRRPLCGNQSVRQVTPYLSQVRRTAPGGFSSEPIEALRRVHAETLLPARDACAAAGANCFIAGSGLFAYDDMSQAAS